MTSTVILWKCALQCEFAVALLCDTQPECLNIYKVAADM